MLTSFIKIIILALIVANLEIMTCQSYLQEAEVIQHLWEICYPAKADFHHGLENSKLKHPVMVN